MIDNTRVTTATIANGIADAKSRSSRMAFDIWFSTVFSERLNAAAI